MFQRKPQRQIKSNQQKSLSRKHSHSPHHRGSTKVRQVVRVLSGRAPRGECGLRLQDSQECHSLYALAQTSLRRNNQSIYLRQNQVRCRQRGLGYRPSVSG